MQKLMKKSGTKLAVKLLTILTLILFVGGSAVAADQTVQTVNNQAKETPAAEEAAAAAVSGTGEGSAAALVAPAVAIGVAAGTIVVVPIATGVFEGGKQATTHTP